MAQYSDLDLKEIYGDISRSKDKGVSGFADILLRIWNIEKVDWKAVKKLILGLEGGRNLIRKMENLPYFEEVVDGKYGQIIKRLDKKEQQDMFRQWEFVEFKYLSPMEDLWVDKLMKERTKTGSTKRRNNQRVARELVGLAREILSTRWKLKKAYIHTSEEDVLSFSVPLLIRIMEYSKEDAETDLDLHVAVEKMLELGAGGTTLTMEDYNTIVGGKSGD